MRIEETIQQTADETLAQIAKARARTAARKEAAESELKKCHKALPLVLADIALGRRDRSEAPKAKRRIALLQALIDDTPLILEGLHGLEHQCWLDKERAELLAKKRKTYARAKAKIKRRCEMGRPPVRRSVTCLLQIAEQIEAQEDCRRFISEMEAT